MTPIIYAIIAAFAFGFYVTLHRLAAPYISQALGAMLIAGGAALIGGAVFLLQKKPEHLLINGKGLFFVALAGLSAFLIDYFSLKAYSSGLQITVGGPLIIGGSIAVATTAGFFIGDSITLVKLIGILLLVGGAMLLVVFP